MITKLKLRLHTLLSSGGFKKYFTNTSWLLAERIITMGVAFIVGAFVARHLGAEGMGILAYALSLSGFADVFIKLGTTGILTRNLVREPEQANKLLGSALALRGIGALFSAVGAIGVMALFPHDTRTTIVIAIILSSVVVTGSQVVFSFFESKVITKFDARLKIVSLVIVSSFKLALVFIFQSDVVWFAISYLLNEMINFIGQMWIYHSRGLGSVRNWKVDRVYMKQLFSQSWPMMFTALVTAIYMQTDQIMIKHMLNEAETGIYFISNKFAKIFIFIPVIVNSSLATAVYNAKKESHEKFLVRIQNLLDFLVVVSLTIIIGVLIFGPILIRTIYGMEFERSSEVLMIHAWTLLFIAIGGGSSTYLMAMNLEKMAFIRTAIAACVNVVLNYFMIPYYGVTGAAYATLITQAIGSYLAYLTSPKTFEIFMLQSKALFLISPIKRIISKGSSA